MNRKKRNTTAENKIIQSFDSPEKNKLKLIILLEERASESWNRT